MNTKFLIQEDGHIEDMIKCTPHKYVIVFIIRIYVLRSLSRVR